MIINPNRIQFETKNDVIDYVTKGLPPSRKNFDIAMSVLRNSNEDVVTESEFESDVINVIPMTNNSIIPNDHDREMIDAALTRVYENRIRNRNIAIGITGVVVAGIIICGIKSHNKKDDDDNLERNK